MTTGAAQAWASGADCAPVVARSDDGAQISACAHGGQLLSWQPAPPADRDVLWLSPIAHCGPGEAIRGGVPVIFPQFAGRGPLPKHGLARDRRWRLTVGATQPAGTPVGPAVIEAQLTDDGATRTSWPHAFGLTLRMTAAGNRLDLTMRVENPGTEPFTFTAALHSYLAAEPESTLHGLDGATAEDNAAGLAEITLPAGPLPATATRDLAIRDLAGGVRLRRPACEILLQRNGFADLVVWNPGPEHGLRDVPDGPAGFVCLEPAQLTPVTLAPDRTWTASATFTQDTRGRPGDPVSG